MNGKSKTSRREENQTSPYIKILIGAVLAIALYFIILALFAVFVLKSGIESSAYMPTGVIIGAVSAFVGGFAAVRPIKQKGALYGGLAGLIQALISSLVLFFANGYSAGNGVFILSAVIILCSVLGGILAVNMKRKMKY